MKATTFAQLVLQVAFSEEYMVSPEASKGALLAHILTQPCVSMWWGSRGVQAGAELEAVTASSIPVAMIHIAVLPRSAHVFI